MTRSPLETVAERFFANATDLVSRARTDGRIAPQIFVETYWSFPGFAYGPNGPVPGNGSGQPREIKNWSKAAEILLAEVKREGTYRELLAEIESTPKPETIDPEAFLDGQIRAFLDYVLSEPPHDTEAARQASEFLQLHLSGHPVPHGVNARIGGIVVPDGPIRLRYRDLSITIRQTERADVEVPVSFRPGPFIHSAPDCIASIRLSGRPFLDAQVQEDRLITILRLFTGAAAVNLGTELQSVPWGQSIGYSYTGQGRFPWRKVPLEPHDQQSLQQFWERFVELLPPSVGPSAPKTPESIAVAFERFNDALDAGGSFERSVTSAVMGLEALYLKPAGEQAELTYRLCNRAARSMAYLGRNPVQTREVIDLAYDVRSGYVHGGRTTLKDRKRIERLYKSLTNFQIELLELLRFSLVASLLRALEKEEFIELVDECLIDPSKGAQLEGLFAEAKNLLTRPVKV